MTLTEAVGYSHLLYKIKLIVCSTIAITADMPAFSHPLLHLTGHAAHHSKHWHPLSSVRTVIFLALSILLSWHSVHNVCYAGLPRRPACGCGASTEALRHACVFMFSALVLVHTLHKYSPHNPTQLATSTLRRCNVVRDRSACPFFLRLTSGVLF